MWEVTENMIEILVFYINIGAIFGLLHWIVDSGYAYADAEWSVNDGSSYSTHLIVTIFNTRICETIPIFLQEGSP